MKGFKKGEFDLSSGLGKFIHVMLWPIRKFYITIPLAALIYVTPIFLGAKPGEVWSWYKEKTIKTYGDVESSKLITDSVSRVKEMFTNVEMEEYGGVRYAKTNDEERGKDTLVDIRKPRTQAATRKGFDVAGSDIPRIEIEVDGVERPVELKSEPAIEEEIEEIVVQPTDVTTGKKSLKNKVVIKPNDLPLNFLKEPQEVEGQAMIINSNELDIDGKIILLYGVYVAPNSSIGFKAKSLLEEKVKNKLVQCVIVATTKQDIATAVCFVDDENLNKLLVDKGLSENVALY